MSYDLTNLAVPVVSDVFIGTIFGEPGRGKTTLGALFNRPVFIRTEDGTKTLKGHPTVKLFPVVEKVQDVFDQVESLLNQDHDFKTLVIDSITQFSSMVEDEIVKADSAKNINNACGGFGAGLSQAATMHYKLRDLVGVLSREKNMIVLFIAHAETISVKMPDLTEYGKYSIRVHKKSINPYIENVDLVCQVRLKSFMTGDKGNEIPVSEGEREIIAFPQDISVCKNRMRITKPLDFPFNGKNPFQPYM